MSEIARLSERVDYELELGELAGRALWRGMAGRENGQWLAPILSCPILAPHSSWWLESRLATAGLIGWAGPAVASGSPGIRS